MENPWALGPVRTKGSGAKGYVPTSVGAVSQGGWVRVSVTLGLGRRVSQIQGRGRVKVRVKVRHGEGEGQL